MVIFLFFQRSRLCVCDVRPWKGIVELKGAEVAAATVPPAVAHSARGAYGRPDPRVEADSIDFDVWAGSKETDLRRKAAENAHRQAQAGVAEFRVPSWRRCMVSQSFAMASHSPGILDSRERSAAVQGPAMAYICRYSVCLLSASEPVPGSDQPGRNADWMIGGDLRRASGRADHRAVPVPALLCPL